MQKIPVILTFILFVLINYQILQSQTTAKWSATKQQLWKLEQRYMQNYKEKNLDSLTTFWHKDFVGWPQWATKPVNISVADSILQKPSDKKVVNFKIRPQKIVTHEKIAIVYYYIDVEYKDTKNKQFKVSTRIIHTWIYENSKWSILGGMSRTDP